MAQSVSPCIDPTSKTALGRGVCEGEAFAFLSEAHLTFPWQGNRLPGIGRLVIDGGKDKRGV